MGKRICSVEICDRPAIGAGFCSGHYQRFKRNGTPGDSAIKAFADPGEFRVCSLCGRTAICRGMCAAHYRKWRHQRIDAPRCVIIDCHDSAVSRDMCEMHYARWSRVSRPDGKRRRGRPPVGLAISYMGAHQRVRSTFGGAHMYDCAACAKPAEDWAYDHEDANQLWWQQNSCWYSADPTHYLPMCKKCHNKFDNSGLTWSAFEKGAEPWTLSFR